ncbi:glycine zipper domain-containing protein [Nocardia terpenica]|uniref:glycine zipper domain-containing protein n=1 Tax=Nocardia terpenica TaxID=455432 RepID=UPI0018E0B044|nr:hypothetical protein [Nocardia terpenica]
MSRRDQFTRGAAAVFAAAAAGLGLAAFAPAPDAVAQGYIPCDQWQQMHPGWPCVDVPTPPPAPPGGQPTQPPPLPSAMPPAPGQSGTSGGIGAGALTPPPVGPGNGTPIVPVPGATPPVLPGNQPPARPAIPIAPQPGPAQSAAPQPAPAPPAPEPSAPIPVPGNDIAAQLNDAIRLHDRGVLSDKEFADIQQRILHGTTPISGPPAPQPSSGQRHPVGRGPDSRIPLLLLAGAAAFVAPVLRRRGSSTEVAVHKPGGGEQTFILMVDPTAPREYRFRQQIPPGGRLRENPDGSVDVLDAAGNVVEHTNPPWAYDALGRSVHTWYDVDGDTIVQHIEPGDDETYPILADPDTVPSCSITSDGQGGSIIKSDQLDGSTHIVHTDSGNNVTSDMTVPKGATEPVGPNQQAADQLARAHGDVPDDFTGHVPLPPDSTTDASPSTSPSPTPAPQPDYQPTPAEQQAADQLARAHGDVPDGYTGHVPVAPPSGTQRPEAEDPWSSRAATGAAGGTQELGNRMGEVFDPSGKHAYVPATAEEAERLGTVFKGLGRAGLGAGIGLSVYDGVSGYQSGKYDGGEASAVVVGEVGGGALGGALAGAAVGSFAGPVGTAIGAGIGAAVGSEVGQKLALGVEHFLFD